MLERYITLLLTFSYNSKMRHIRNWTFSNVGESAWEQQNNPIFILIRFKYEKDYHCAFFNCCSSADD